MSNANVATITFTINDEQFDVLLPGIVFPNGTIDFYSSSQRFLELLYELNLLEPNVIDADNSHVKIDVVSNKGHQISLRIRKKAKFMGLDVNYGEVFSRRRENASKHLVNA